MAKRLELAHELDYFGVVPCVDTIKSLTGYGVMALFGVPQA
jgi:hypothetical protein